MPMLVMVKTVLHILALACCFPSNALALKLGLVNGGSSFFLPIREGFEASCNASGVEMFARVASPSVGCDCVCARWNVVRELVSLGVDGIAMKPCQDENSVEFIQYATDNGVPVVTFDSDSKNSSRIANVGTDQEFMGRTMARLLRQLRPEGGTFAIIGEKAGRVEGFVEEITKDNDRADRKHWRRLDLNNPIGVNFTFLDRMADYAKLNVTAFLSFKQAPMKEENWTQFVEKNKFRGHTYIGVDNADYQLEYLNRRYVDGLIGQLPYEIGTESFRVLMKFIKEGKLEKDMYPTNVVAYNLIPLELPAKVVEQNLIGNLKYVGYTCFSVVVLSTLLCSAWTIHFRMRRVVKAAQPFFLLMVAGGVLILSSTMIPLSFEDGGDPNGMSEAYAVGICMSVPWLAFTGLTITFSALFSKTWRVNRLFHAKVGHARLQVSERDVLAPFGIILTCNTIVLICWTVVDPLTYIRQFQDGTDFWNRETTSYGACRSENSEAFLAPLAVMNLSVVAIACWQAYEARSIKSEFSEAKFIGLAMFSLFQAFLTGIPVIAVVRDMPEAYYLVLTLMIFILSMAVLWLIFIPKMIMLRHYAGLSPEDQKKRMDASVQLSAAKPTTNRTITLKKNLRYSKYNPTSQECRAVSGLSSTDASVYNPIGGGGHRLPKMYHVSTIESVTDCQEFQEGLIEQIMDGFIKYHEKKFNAAPIQTLGAPPMAPFTNIQGYQAQTCVKSGYFEDFPHYVIKVASGGYPMTNSGSIQLYSQTTGEMECLLFDQGILTELRTAAVGAVAAKLLGPNPKSITRIGILGTGVQARYQLLFLKYVTECRDVLVWGRSSEGVDTFVEYATSEGWSCHTASRPNELLEQCEIVVTTTSSREALLFQTEHDETNPVRLITCIGADAPGKKELDTSLVKSAAVLVADSLEQSVVRGEFQHLCHEDDGDKGLILTLGQVAANPDLQRHDQDDGLVIFDSSGVALQDAVIAQMVYEALNPSCKLNMPKESALSSSSDGHITSELPPVDGSTKTDDDITLSSTGADRATTAFASSMSSILPHRTVSSVSH